MSIAAELLIREIADRIGDVALLSDFGDGCPLLDEAASPPVRMALRPVGGILRRDDFAAFSPPLSLSRRGADCARLAKRKTVVVDALRDDAERLLATAEALSRNCVAALRVRGGPCDAGAMKLIYEDAASSDRIFLRRDLVDDALLARAGALGRAEVDEFDALIRAIGQANAISGLRHGVSRSEALLNPVAFLDQPDGRQIAAALADGRAALAEDGGCALFAPQLSGSPMPVSVTLSHLDPAAPDPIAYLPGARGWSLTTTRRGGRWRAAATPGPAAGSSTSVFLEIAAPDSPMAEIAEIATTITRKRGAWEIWDEAQSRLELEESW